MKKLMILGASILQLPAIEKAKKMGLEVIAVDMNPEAVGFTVEGVKKEVISTIDTESVLVAAREHKIDGIMTLASDMPMRTVAAVAKELELVGVTEETALAATDKGIMRQRLQEFGVPVPAFYKVNTRDEYYQAINKLGVKCIVKPADNSGSRGVDLLSNLEDSQEIEKAYHYSKSFSRNGTIVVEEYMEGPEVSVETLSLAGKCHVIQITDKLTTGAPYFVEMGHNQPSLLPKNIQQQIEKVAKMAVKALGIQNGPSHTEIKVTSEGPKIVEIGARLGGDNITTHLVPLSTGVDMVEACIRIALGEIPDLESKFAKASAVRYFDLSSGLIEKIDGVEEAEQLEGIKQISIVHGIGENSVEIKSSVDRVGFVIAQAEEPQIAIERCENAMRIIKIDIKQ
mgnify:FL=1